MQVDESNCLFPHNKTKKALRLIYTFKRFKKKKRPTGCQKNVS